MPLNILSPAIAICLTALLTLTSSGHVNAGKRDSIAGPILARVVNIYDGDTIEVMARVWPGHQILVKVRIRGIDAPEMRAKCPAERRAALDARDLLSQIIGDRPVRLTNIKGGKYFGRVLASAENETGQDVESALLATGMVRPYRGKQRQGWC